MERALPLYCNGTTFVMSTYSGSSTCSNTPSNITAPGSCSTIGSGSQRSTCGGGGGLCFHKDSQIELADRSTVTLASLGRASSKCAVPHVLESVLGVRIETACKGVRPLRLTADHLVFTQRGLVAAGTVRPGDYLFRDLAQTQQCAVTATGREFGTYFGLNCEESTVLSDGFKTSTFGYTHALPAAWMHYASKVLGVQRASSIGDSVVSFLYRWSIISN